MKDVLRAIVTDVPTGVDPRNVVREYLQARVLGALQRSGAMLSIAFQGGTALRFLYRTARYSEDLDFALELDRERYDFRGYLRAVKRELEAEAYDVRIIVKDSKTVESAFLRFPGLLFDLALSPHVEQALAVKLEVDTRPPAGAVLETTLVRRFEILRLLHHDRSSLLAGKVNALMTRPFVKGRDIYDLVWHLSDPTHPGPNMALLRNALAQFGWSGPAVTEEDWRGLVWSKLAEVDWAEVRRDVRPFLERPSDEDLVTREVVAAVLGVA